MQAQYRNTGKRQTLLRCRDAACRVSFRDYLWVPKAHAKFDIDLVNVWLRAKLRGGVCSPEYFPLTSLQLFPGTVVREITAPECHRVYRSIPTGLRRVCRGRPYRCNLPLFSGNLLPASVHIKGYFLLSKQAQVPGEIPE